MKTSKLVLTVTGFHKKGRRGYEVHTVCQGDYAGTTKRLIEGFFGDLGLVSSHAEK